MLMYELQYFINDLIAKLLWCTCKIVAALETCTFFIPICNGGIYIVGPSYIFHVGLWKKLRNVLISILCSAGLWKMKSHTCQLACTIIINETWKIYMTNVNQFEINLAI